MVKLMTNPLKVFVRKSKMPMKNLNPPGKSEGILKPKNCLMNNFYKTRQQYVPVTTVLQYMVKL